MEDVKLKRGIWIAGERKKAGEIISVNVKFARSLVFRNAAEPADKAADSEEITMKSSVAVIKAELDRLEITYDDGLKKAELFALLPGGKEA